MDSGPRERRRTKSFCLADVASPSRRWIQYLNPDPKLWPRRATGCPGSNAQECVLRFHVFTLGKLGERLATHVFTFFTCRILGERFATLPPSHRSTHRGALGLRGFHVFTFSRVEFWVNERGILFSFFFFGVAVPLHANWTLTGSEVTTSLYP